MKLRIDDCMAPGPIVIEKDAPMAEAHRLMRAHGVRHLPVVSESELVGILSIRDLHLLETLQDIDQDSVAVSEAMNEHPYSVDPTSDLRTVVLNMHARKIGSAVVVEDSKIVGLFTTTDALRALANLLE